MTKKHLFNWFVVASIIYLVSIGIGVILSILDNTKNNIVYTTYIDMIPLIITIPAAWLGYCLQRRSSYLQQLRILWSTLISAIQKATIFTYILNPTNKQFAVKS